MAAWKPSQHLILADAGGSSTYRARLWNKRLQAVLSDPLGLQVSVRHSLPNGLLQSGTRLSIVSSAPNGESVWRGRSRTAGLFEMKESSHRVALGRPEALVSVVSGFLV
jgi:hypothetical protein